MDTTHSGLEGQQRGYRKASYPNRADVNVRDKDGLTPLLWASENGNEAIAFSGPNSPDLNIIEPA
jgi:ankyrin repeat protein